MKTSYKLYGSAWDRQPIPTKCPVIKTTEYFSEGTVLKLSELMNEENPQMVATEEKVFLNIDFIPKTNSTVTWDFYLKRLLQIAECYKAELVSCLDLEQSSKLNKSLMDFYKRKTPERSLAQSVGAFQMIC